MAGTTGFFDAARQYTAQEFARALRAASTPGVVQGIGNQYAVTAGPGLGVTVDTGFVTILGNWRFDDTTQAVALLAADLTNPRIDRIIARLTISTKTVEITKLTGTPAGSPIAPSLTQGSDVYEIPLAQIAVAANAASITSGNVIDQRQFSGAVLSDHKHTGTAGGGGTLGRATGLASATGLTLPTDGEQIPITGTTAIGGIVAGAVGRTVVLEAQSAGLRMPVGSTLKLRGDWLSCAPLDTLTLYCDGTNWLERARAMTPPRCTLRSSVTQVIAASTITALLFDTEDDDNAGLHSTVSNTSRITFPIAGIWLYGAMLSLPSGISTGSRFIGQIRLNGATVMANEEQSQPQAGTFIGLNPVRGRLHAAGDYIEAIVYQDSSGSVTLVASANIFWAVWVGPA
jgi:hypothetical protein